MASSINPSLTTLELVCKTHPESCNGVCDPITYECKCSTSPSGIVYVHDKVLWRYNNCALPQHYLTGLCITSMCLCFIAQLIIVKWYLGKTGSAAHIIRAATLSNVSLFLAFLATLLYQEVNPAFWFFMSLAITGAGYGFTTYLYSFFIITFKTTHQEVPEAFLRRIFIASMVLISSPGFLVAFPASIAFGTTNPELYNNLVAVFFFCLPIQLLVTVPLLVRISTRLIAHITQSALEALVFVFFPFALQLAFFVVSLEIGPIKGANLNDFIYIDV